MAVHGLVQGRGVREPECRHVCGLLHSFSSQRTIEGLSPEVGRAAALFALLLAAVAAVAWARPGLARRLPLGRCALLAGYFGIAVGVQTRSDAQNQIPGEGLHYAYGAYVGLAATIVILVAAGVERRGELARYRSASRLVLLLLVAGLLGAFLLVWVQGSLYVDGQVAATFADPGIASAAAVVAAALALCLPAAWSRPDAAFVDRLGLTAAVALFTGAAAVSFPPFYGHRAYGVWLALGFAGGLLLLALVNGPRSLRLAELSWRQLAAASAGALFIARVVPALGETVLCSKQGVRAAWRALCLDERLDEDRCRLRLPRSSRSALVVAVLEPRRLRLSVVELAAGFGLLVATIGFQLARGRWRRSPCGTRLRLDDWFHPRRCAQRAGPRALALAHDSICAARLSGWLPIAACAAYLTIIVLPMWDLFQEPFHTPPIYPPLSWLTIAGALLGIHLLGLWARQIVGASGGAELVLVPFALLALAGIDLINQREEALTWGRAAVVGLCLLLGLFGRIEERGGLESARIPEALRIDRL